MIDEIVRVAANASGGAQNDLASVDMIQDGKIMAVAAHLTPKNPGSSDESLRAELSFLSTNQIQSNDARGSICKIEEEIVFATGVGRQSFGRSLFFEFPGGIPVNAGERIHLHSSGSTGADAEITFDMYVDFVGSGSRGASRRR